ncbi:MAG TPA: hypothetical protein VIQ22_07845 [Gammaproteobacteria bacterium]
MDSVNPILLSILIEAGTAMGLLAAGAGLLCGLWLLIDPASFVRLEQRASRNISLRRPLRPLEISRNLDRYIYRHHRGLGLLIIAASAFTLYRLLFRFDNVQAAQLFAGLLPTPLLEALFSALHLALILGHLFAIVTGLVLYLRPSALKGLEAGANRWVSSRQKSRWLDTSYTFPSRLMLSHPRLLGLGVMLLSLYLATLLVVR